MADLRESNKRKANYDSLQDKKKTKTDCTSSISTSFQVCDEIIQKLIDSIVQAKVAEELGPTIIEAIQNNDSFKVWLLIKQGANVNTQSSGGKSLLHLAAQNKVAEMTKLLIKNGADINSKDTYGHTPMHIAAMKNQAKVVDILIQSGANVTYDDIYSYLVTHQSVSGARSVNTYEGLRESSKMAETFSKDT